MTTPNDLYYNTPVENSSSRIGGYLSDCYGKILPEIQDSGIYYLPLDLTSDLVEIRIIKEFHFDFRRFWRLSTIWYDKTPVMVLQQAGREGDDCIRRFITNADSYKKLISHVKSLIVTEINVDVVDPTVENSNLTSFYGNSLDGYFERY